MPPINGDPFTDSQQYPAKFVVEPAVERGETARSTVFFSFDAELRKIFVLLAQENKRWKIIDLIYPNGSTLRKQLELPAN